MISQDPIKDLQYLFDLLESKHPFTFVRFSDGETEILNNNYLEISQNGTKYRGQSFTNSYPSLDYKFFHPNRDILFRDELISSSKYKSDFYFKGISGSHNIESGDNLNHDQELLIGLNNGSISNLTFSDLLINSNYLTFRKRIDGILTKFSKGFVIANFQSKLVGPLNNFDLLPIPNLVFQQFNELLEYHLLILKDVPSKSIILSSDSSYSNILGYKLHKIRSDLFFIDIGTALNDYLSLPCKTRVYHCLLDKSLKGRIAAFRYKRSIGYKIKW
jgi:hypothetical protein